MHQFAKAVLVAAIVLLPTLAHAQSLAAPSAMRPGQSCPA